MPKREFFFSPDIPANLAVGEDGGPYHHIVDANFTCVKVFNNTSLPLAIPRNMRLGHLTDYDADGATLIPLSYHVLATVVDPVVETHLVGKISPSDRVLRPRTGRKGQAKRDLSPLKHVCS